MQNPRSATELGEVVEASVTLGGGREGREGGEREGGERGEGGGRERGRSGEGVGRRKGMEEGERGDVISINKSCVCHVILCYLPMSKLTGSTTVGWTISLPGNTPQVTAMG